MKMDFAGMEEFAAELDALASGELDQVEREALKSGAEIVRRQQQANWNRSTADGEHIEDAINVGRPYDTEEGTGINIGPKMSLRWRAKFVERGTSYQPPQAPIEKSLKQTESAVARAMMDAFEKVIK